MMTRNIRKAISLICVVALILSISIVSIAGTSSAFKQGDDPTGSTLYLPFTGNKGISKVNSNNIGYATDPDDPDNAVVRFNYPGNAGINFEIGKDADVVSEGLNAAHTVGTNAFKFAANTNYVITFKMKVGKGSYTNDNQFSLNYLYINSATGKKDNPTISLTNGTFNFDATNSTLNSKGKYELKDNSEWITVTSVVNTVTPKSLVGSSLFMHLYAAGSMVLNVYIDDFMIDEIDEVNTTKTYNWKNDTTGALFNPSTVLLQQQLLGNSNNTDSEGKYLTYAAADGLHIHCKGGAVDFQSGGWRKNYVVQDADNGGYVPLQAGHVYLVNVKYKLTGIEGNTAKLSVAHSTSLKSSNTLGTEAPESHWAKLISVTATDNITEVQTEWQTLTSVIDVDAREKSGIVTAGTWLYLAPMSQDGTHAVDFLVESVTVKDVFSKNGVGVVNYVTGDGDPIPTDVYEAGTKIDLPNVVSSSSDIGFGGWYSDDTYSNKIDGQYTVVKGENELYAKWTRNFVTLELVNQFTTDTVRIAPGTSLSRPTLPASGEYFCGWYTDLTFSTLAHVAPDSNATYYAKYSKVMIAFDKGGVVGANGKCEFIEDTADASNKVLKFVSPRNGRWNFELGNYDDAKAMPYELDLKGEYVIKFKYKVLAGSAAGDITMMIGDEPSGQYTSRSGTGNTVNFLANETTEDGPWSEVSFSFKMGDTFYLDRVKWAKQSHLFLSAYSTVGDVLLGFDDLSIEKTNADIPEGATVIDFETNGDTVSRLVGNIGEAITMPANPTLPGHEFVGWYTDMRLTKPFTGTHFGETDITLYAKWKTTEYICDFTKYNPEVKGLRCSIVNDGGNMIGRYCYEEGGSTTTSASRFGVNQGARPYKCVRGINYTVSYRYKIVETTGNVTMVCITSAEHNNWTEAKEYGKKTYTNATDGWKTDSIKFTAMPSGVNYGYLNFGINGDATVLIDDLKVEAEFDLANVYGSIVYLFSANGGSPVDPISGEEGDVIGDLPTSTRAGYVFKGWFTDVSCKTPFTATVFGDENATIYAGWALGKFTEGFEKLSGSALTMGISGAYSLYNSSNASFDASNVKEGKNSLFRNGATTGTKGFAVCTSPDYKLDKGQQYTMTFYVKPTNVGDAAGTINLTQMSTNFGISTTDSSSVIKSVGELQAGQWQKVSYTFTATQNYVGIATTSGNDMYFDSFTVTMNGYTGSATGDSAISPIVITLFIVLAAGALVVTGKRVYSK